MQKDLTSEEINLKNNELLQKYIKGDRKIEEQLIKINEKLVTYIIKKNDLPFNDYYSSGLLGLYKAIQTYDLGKNNSFVNYAAPCIKNEIYMQMRKEMGLRNKTNIKTVSFQEKIYSSTQDNSLKFEDILTSGDNSDPQNLILINFEAEENLNLIYEDIKNNFSPIQKKWFNLKINKGLSNKQIKEKMQLTSTQYNRLNFLTLLRLQAITNFDPSNWAADNQKNIKSKAFLKNVYQLKENLQDNFYNLEPFFKSKNSHSFYLILLANKPIIEQELFRFMNKSKSDFCKISSQFFEKVDNLSHNLYCKSNNH